jgi:Tol biopolymer transport system component
MSILVSGVAGSIGDVAWAPSGKAVAFTRRTGRDVALHVAEADGSNERTLATSTDYEVAGGDACDEPDARWFEIAAWTPDGTGVLASVGVACHEETYEDVVIVSALDGSIRRVAATSDVERQPAISPDGSEVAFESEEGLVVTGADGNGRRVIGPGLSPAGGQARTISSSSAQARATASSKRRGRRHDVVRRKAPGTSSPASGTPVLATSTHEYPRMTLATCSASCSSRDWTTWL